MSKEDVEKEKLTAFVLMLEGVEECLKTWGKIETDHEVDVRYPHDKHGLQGHKSNNAKVKERESFLEFVDANSQPNGRRLDSRNPTHFLPKFTAISTPKLSDPNYERKMKSSLVGEFNRIQMESGKPTISSFSGAAWLRDDRSKVAILIKLIIVTFVRKLRRRYRLLSRR